VIWAVVVGAASVVSGVAAGSVALVGFGLDSLIDGSASAAVVWRFRVERDDAARSESVEHTAHRLVAMALLVVALYLVVEGCHSLATRTSPHETGIGIALALASMLVLPVLAVRKLRLARRLRSKTLRADGVLSGAGALLAFFATLGLGLDRAFGWWWSDALAALVIAGVLAAEGLRGLSSRPAVISARRDPRPRGRSA